MALRVARLGLVSLVTIPFLIVNCGSSEDRNFVEQDGSAAAGGTGGNGGSAGSTGGSAGSTGGSAGSTGGTAGSSGSGGGDAGTPCANSTECDDGNSCNGDETCVGNYCQAGTPASNGTACTPPSVGDAGASDAGTAEYACVDAVCSLKCAIDADCNDNDVCTGNEICNPTSKTCQSGSPPACEDNDACTDNECDPISGCFYALIDADGDGHAATTLGACGTDCDDTDPTAYTGGAELCDGKDNNCNGTSDEGAKPTWYADCDKDGYAPNGAQSVADLCVAPTNAPTCDSGLTGGWTNKTPVVGSSDCWDKDAKGHPMTAAQSNAAWSTTSMANIPPVSIDFDFNCDGIEEKRYTTTFVSGTASCQPCGIGGIGGAGGIGGISGIDEPAAAGGIGGIGGGFVCCSGLDGWTSSSPACGTSATFSNCGAVGSNCQRTVGNKPQECR